MAGVSFYVKSDYEWTKNMVDSVLASQGFTLDYSDPFNCSAERGSKTATLLVGAFAGKENQHLQLTLSFHAWDQGGQVVNINTANTGMAAGVIGVTRVQEAFDGVTAIMRGGFVQHSVYAGESAF